MKSFKPANLKTKLCSTRLNGIDMKIRNFSTQVGSPSSQVEFNPWWFVGFTDGEASFIISVTSSKKFKTGFEVRAQFSIDIHKKDLPLLSEIKDFLGVGVITINNKRNDALFRVSKIQDLLTVIIPFFQRYPLISQKQADFKIWVEIIKLMEKRKHLSSEGIKDILALKASLNLGLPPQLQSAFPNISPIPRPIIKEPIPDPNWLSGFLCAEGCH